MTENPAFTLEKFLTLLRKQEREVHDLETGILTSNTVVPDYVEMLKAAINEARNEALIEAAEAAARVKLHGVSIHDQYIAQAKPVIERMEKIPNYVGSRPAKNTRPADLMYVGKTYTVSVSPNATPNDSP